jgi:membrane protease YdiL (CAAX protease family)
MPPAPPPAPGPSGGLRAAYAAIGGELLAVLLLFVCAGVFIANIPGLVAGLDALARALLGPPAVAAPEFRKIVAVTVTPLATLLAAFLHHRLARGLDGDAPGPASPGLPTAGLPPPAPLLASASQTALHLAAAIAGSYVLAVAMHLLGLPVAEQPLVLEIVASPRGPEVAVLAVSALALAPLGEELLFRRQLFRRLQARVGPGPALLASALLFAAVHMNLQGLVVYAWLGLVFARVYAVTGRLGAAVAVHFGNNAVTLAFLLLSPTPAP